MHEREEVLEQVLRKSYSRSSDDRMDVVDHNVGLATL